MWHRAANDSSVKPAEADRTLSGKYVYIRKNFIETPTLDMDGEKIGTHWEYDEMAIPLDDWEAFQTAMGADERSRDNAANIDYLAMMSDIEL